MGVEDLSGDAVPPLSCEMAWMQAGYLLSTSLKALREILAAERGVGLAIAALRRWCGQAVMPQKGGHSDLQVTLQHSTVFVKVDKRFEFCGVWESIKSG